MYCLLYRAVALLDGASEIRSEEVLCVFVLVSSPKLTKFSAETGSLVFPSLLLSVNCLSWFSKDRVLIIN